MARALLTDRRSEAKGDAGSLPYCRIEDTCVSDCNDTSSKRQEQIINIV